MSSIKKSRAYAVKYFFFLFVHACLPSACTPRVELGGSDKPITINMNVKIDHEVRVKVEKDLDSVISADSDLF